MAWGAAIGAAATVAGSVIGASGGSDQTPPSVRLEQYRRSDKFLRRSVIDAKKAGLHPLFALGTSTNMSPTFSGMGPSSGSYIGEGIARAGEQIQSGIAEDKRAKRTTQLDAASAQIHALRLEKMKREISLDDAQLMKMASDQKLAEQQMGYWGNPGGMGGMEAKTFPYGVERGMELHRRPLTQTSRQSNPLVQELVGPDGFRYKVLTDDAGDEIKQIHLAWKLMERGARKIWMGRQLQAKLNKYRKRRAFKRSDTEFTGGS